MLVGTLQLLGEEKIYKKKLLSIAIDENWQR